MYNYVGKKRLRKTCGFSCFGRFTWVFARMTNTSMSCFESFLFNSDAAYIEICYGLCLKT